MRPSSRWQPDQPTTCPEIGVSLKARSGALSVASEHERSARPRMVGPGGQEPHRKGLPASWNGGSRRRGGPRCPSYGSRYRRLGPAKQPLLDKIGASGSLAVARVLPPGRVGLPMARCPGRCDAGQYRGDLGEAGQTPQPAAIQPQGWGLAASSDPSPSAGLRRRYKRQDARPGIAAEKRVQRHPHRAITPILGCTEHLPIGQRIVRVGAHPPIDDLPVDRGVSRRQASGLRQPTPIDGE